MVRRQQRQFVTEKMDNHQQYLFVTIMMELIQLQSLIQMEVKQKQ